MKDNNPYNEDNWVGALGDELPGYEHLPLEERRFTLVCMHCEEPMQGSGLYRMPDCCDDCRETVTEEQRNANYIKHTKDHFNQRRLAVKMTKDKISSTRAETIGGAEISRGDNPDQRDDPMPTGGGVFLIEYEGPGFTGRRVTPIMEAVEKALGRKPDENLPQTQQEDE